MNAYLETIATWNEIANQYETIFMDLDIYNASYSTFCNTLESSSPSILETGCGPGNITQHILRIIPKATILATDVAPAMISLSQKNNPTALHQVLDCRNISALSESFDGIISGFTIPYLAPADCMQYLVDAHKLLNAKGVFYLSFVAGDPEKSGYISGSTGDRTFFYFYTLRGILEALEKIGFKITSTEEVSFQRKTNTEQHTIIIAQKIN